MFGASTGHSMRKGRADILPCSPWGVAGLFVAGVCVRLRVAEGPVSRGNIMVDFIKSFARDESGASAAAYALILVVIGLGIVAGGIALRGAIGTAMSKASNCVTNGTTTSCS